MFFYFNVMKSKVGMQKCMQVGGIGVEKMRLFLFEFFFSGDRSKVISREGISEKLEYGRERMSDGIVIFESIEV